MEPSIYGGQAPHLGVSERVCILHDIKIYRGERRPDKGYPTEEPNRRPYRTGPL